MKTLLTLLWVCCVFCSTALSQSMHGTYSNTWENSNGFALTYTLTLRPSGSFIFESIRMYEDADPTQVLVVKGTWEQDDRLLVLHTESSIEDNELAKDLNRSKAKYVEYSARHIQYDNIQPSLKFYQSDVFYAKGMVLEKEPMDVITFTDEEFLDD